MDQVRDLLFGAQVRQIEDRLQRQEEMVKRYLESLQKELKDTIATLEANINSRFKDTINRQNETNEALDSSIVNLKGDLESKSRILSETIGRTEGSLMTLIADSNDRLVAALSDRHAAALNAIKNLETNLRCDLVDKSVLSLLLGEMAIKIGDKIQPKDDEPSEQNDENE
jgi:hypothetical protein